MNSFSFQWNMTQSRALFSKDTRILRSDSLGGSLISQADCALAARIRLRSVFHKVAGFLELSGVALLFNKAREGEKLFSCGCMDA